MNDEKTRAAAGIAVTLSTQLVGAALTMLGLLAAFITFTIDKRHAGWLFVVLSVGTFATFIVAIVLGGKAIADLYRMVADGSWEPKRSSGAFNMQAMITVVAIGLFVLSLVFSTSAENSDTSRQLDALYTSHVIHEQRLGHLDAEVAALSARSDSIPRQRSPSECLSSGLARPLRQLVSSSESRSCYISGSARARRRGQKTV